MIRPARADRRGLLRSACLHCAVLGLGGIPAWVRGQPAPAAPQAGASAPVGDWPRLTRPTLDTDEGGLWAAMDRAEAQIRRSPFLVRESGIADYLRNLVCRLAGNHCPDVRVYLERTPLFNASMAPNGMMTVWTGLMLRVENEAQLAAVLGHEIGHYVERHTVEQLRDAKSRAAFAQFLGLFGAVGALGQIGVLAGMFAFSREHEVRADRIGLELMTRAGYDPTQAAQIWDNLLAELKVTGGEDAGRRSPMFASHPPPENRRNTLLALAGNGRGESGADTFREAVARHRLTWLQDEIRRGQYEESLALFDRLLVQRPADAELRYARGEVFRTRGAADDGPRALDELTGATQLDGAPPIAFRSLGLVHKQRGDNAAASAAFRKYLELSPDAGDAALVRNYLQEMTK